MSAANWRKVKWDDRYWGYGGDDGRIRRDARQAGLTERRHCAVFHVDHPGEAEAKNQPGHGRPGAYGRDSGFNPDNFDSNRKLMEQ